MKYDFMDINFKKGDTVKSSFLAGFFLSFNKEYEYFRIIHYVKQKSAYEIGYVYEVGHTEDYRLKYIRMVLTEKIIRLDI